MPVDQGWHPDPTGRHEWRYWDGSGWTEHVSDGGVHTLDGDRSGGGERTPPAIVGRSDPSMWWTQSTIEDDRSRGSDSASTSTPAPSSAISAASDSPASTNWTSDSPVATPSASTANAAPPLQHSDLPPPPSVASGHRLVPVVMITDYPRSDSMGGMSPCIDESAQLLLEPGDGEVFSFVCERVEFETGGVKSKPDGQAHVYISQSRLVVLCHEYDKGGGWIGVPGVTLIALNAVSKARAKRRRAGTVAVAQVRFPWVSGILHQHIGLGPVKIDLLHLIFLEDVNGTTAASQITMTLNKKFLPVGTDRAGIAELLLRRVVDDKMGAATADSTEIEGLRHAHFSAMEVKNESRQQAFSCTDLQPAWTRSPMSVGNGRHNALNTL